MQPFQVPSAICANRSESYRPTITFYGIHDGQVIRIADSLEPEVIDDGQVFSPKRPSAIHSAGHGDQ